MRPDHETLVTQYTLLPITYKKLSENATRGFGQQFAACLQRYRTRRQLLKLSAEQLQDIGVTREQARREARQPFWR